MPEDTIHTSIAIEGRYRYTSIWWETWANGDRGYFKEALGRLVEDDPTVSLEQVRAGCEMIASVIREMEDVKGENMARYEYKVMGETSADQMQIVVDEMSADGWRLISTQRGCDCIVYFVFERPVSLPIAAYLNEEGRARFDRCVEKAMAIMERHKGKTP